MKRFFASLRTSVVLITILTLLLGIGYPLFMYCVGQLFFHKEANGSLVFLEGKPIGSSLIGQNFTDKKYFHPRPSSAGDKGYDATSSSGSNLGPTSQKLIVAIDKRVTAYRSENGLDADTVLPAEAVTTSGSGLDPHISPADAYLQAARVASARGMAIEGVNNLIEKFTEGSTLWLFGEPRVNVLLLNLELNKIQ